VKLVSDDVTNLKNNLRDAAYRNVADKAAGDLVPVGYKGNFVSSCNHDPINFATYPFVVGESLFLDVRYCTNTPQFLKQDYYYINVIAATNPSLGGQYNRPLIQFVSYTSSTSIYAIREDDGLNTGWRNFREVQYDADNATITAPGFIRACNGNTELGQNAIFIRGYGNKHLWFFKDNAEMALIYAGDDAVLRLRGGGGPSLNIGPDGSISAPGYFAAGDDIHSGRNISNVGLIQAGAGVYDTPGVRVYSPNNPPPRDQYAAPNTAWLTGGQMWWRCGSSGAMRVAAVVGGVPNSGRVTFPTAFPNVCNVVIPTRNEESGQGAAMQPYNVDRTGFNLRIAGGGTVTLMYVAEGY
jgi:hypothetical protein